MATNDRNDADDLSSGPNDTNDTNDAPDTWVPDETIAAMAMERQLMHASETEEQMARRLFRENAANAAASICHIAMHGTNERLRLDASKYVIERVLGRVGDDAYDVNPVDAFLRDVLKEAV